MKLPPEQGKPRFRARASPTQILNQVEARLTAALQRTCEGRVSPSPPPSSRHRDFAFAAAPPATVQLVSNGYCTSSPLPRQLRAPFTFNHLPSTLPPPVSLPPSSPSFHPSLFYKPQPPGAGSTRRRDISSVNHVLSLKKGNGVQPVTDYDMSLMLGPLADYESPSPSSGSGAASSRERFEQLMAKVQQAQLRAAVQVISLPYATSRSGELP